MYKVNTFKNDQHTLEDPFKHHMVDVKQSHPLCQQHPNGNEVIQIKWLVTACELLFNDLYTDSKYSLSRCKIKINHRHRHANRHGNYTACFGIVCFTS